MNIIDTLTAGFNTVTRKLWLIIVPVLLDLFLWLGPKVSVEPVVSNLFSSYRQLIETGGAALDPDLVQIFTETMGEAQAALSRANLLSLLAWGRIGFPSITSTRPIDPLVDRVYEITGTAQWMGVSIAALAGGLVIACILLGMVGQVVRGERLDLVRLTRRLPVYWKNLVLVLIPMSIGMVVAAVIGFALGPFAFFVWVGLIWVLLLLSFVPQAITMAEASPLMAIRDSLIVVRLNFWPTLGLIVLTNVIGAGLVLVMQPLRASSVGIALAILVNAYIGTGLLTAAFIFYRDRLALWHELIAQQRSESSHA
ncbi:MAG: hypothetical protein ACYC5M_18475 [Anaerolineae bacterium]